MRTNGFIYIALGLTAGALAGTPGYLPSVGPLALRFEREAPPRITLPEPAPEPTTHAGPNAREDFTANLPVESPTNSAPTTMMPEPPVTVPLAAPDLGSNALANPIQTLISPMTETNGMVTPQMFLRFFTPPQGGVSHETVLVAPPGFNPARPPAPSSTATYTKSKP